MTAPVYLLRAHDVAARQIGDEFMIMSGKDSSLFSLNETAALLWQSADGKTPLDEIVSKRICAEFEVDEGTALADALAVAAELAELGILRVLDAPRGDAVSLMQEMSVRALKQGIPLRVHLDLTYRCNERCVHCYLDHEDHGELTTAEVTDLLDQMADAGVFFLNISGGEIFMRKDLFEIIEYARKLQFSVKLKTNGVMVKKAKAERLAALGIEDVQISLYSDKAEVHDAITKLPGSFKRTVEGARLLREAGIKVTFANVLMTHNANDYRGVQDLAAGMGIKYTVDATITPMMDGDRSILALNVDPAKLEEVFHDASLLGEGKARFNSAPSGPVSAEEAYATIPCSAGHNACYVSPYGEVYPCVQFPYLTGNIREQKFIDIWRNSPQMLEVRAIRVSDVQGCSTCVHGGNCSRCPGLAYLEGNMRGPSIQDCEKSFARTGVPSKNLERKRAEAAAAAPKAAKFPIPIVVLA